MRILFYVLLLFLNISFLNAQSESIKCLRGEKDDELTHYDDLSNGTHLLNIRSNSHTEDYTSPIDSSATYSSYNWLFGMDDLGNILWKKYLSNTRYKLYKDYINMYYTFFPIVVNHYDYNIYTIKNNEILLHYDYLEPTNTIVPDSIGNILFFDFGILQENGVYKIEPFKIDSLSRENNLIVSDIRGNKINDSIYQLAVNCMNKYGTNYYNFTTTYFSIFYTVNINSKFVSKSIINGLNTIATNKNRSLIINTTNGISTYSADSRGIIKNYSFNIPHTPDSYLYFDYSDDNLLYSNAQILDTINNSFNKARLLKINLNDSTYLFRDLGVCNNIHCTNSISGNLHSIDYFYPKFEDINAAFKHVNYFLYTVSYDSNWINTYSFTALQFDNNSLQTIKSLNLDASTYEFEQQDGNLLFIQSYPFNDSFGNLKTEVHLAQVDSNYILRAVNKIPKSITNGIDTFTLDEYSFLNYLKLFKYKNNFIIGLQYAHENKGKLDYFLIKYNDTLVTPIQLSDYCTNSNYEPYNYLYQDPTKNVFYTSGNILYFYSNNFRACDTSIYNLDVQLFRYIDPISSIKNESISSNLFQIFPNPASDKLNMKVSEKEAFGKIRIYAINGKLVFEKQVTSSYETINTADWANGLYILSYQTKDKIQNEKLVIQR